MVRAEDAGVAAAVVEVFPGRLTRVAWTTKGCGALERGLGVVKVSSGVSRSEVLRYQMDRR